MDFESITLLDHVWPWGACRFAAAARPLPHKVRSTANASWHASALTALCMVLSVACWPWRRLSEARQGLFGVQVPLLLQRGRVVLLRHHTLLRALPQQPLGARRDGRQGHGSLPLQSGQSSHPRLWLSVCLLTLLVSHAVSVAVTRSRAATTCLPRSRATARSTSSTRRLVISPFRCGLLLSRVLNCVNDRCLCCRHGVRSRMRCVPQRADLLSAAFWAVLQ